MIKALKRTLIGLLGGLLVLLHFFDGVYAANITVSGTAPSTNADGSPLTDLASLRVYKATAADVPSCASATYSVAATVPFTMAGQPFAWVDSNQTQSTTYCYRVTALDTSSNESVLSNIATKKLDLLAPSGITDLKAN
jgi:hypothetical protein